MTRPELHHLADAAASAMVGLLDDDASDLFDEMSDLEKIQYRYLYGDCDDFALALYRATGWPLRAVVSLDGPLHLLNEAPDGRLADASGWTDLHAIGTRYRIRGLTLSPPGGEELCMSRLQDDNDLQPVISAMLYLDSDPFSNLLKVTLQNYYDRIDVLQK